MVNHLIKSKVIRFSRLSEGTCRTSGKVDWMKKMWSLKLLKETIFNNKRANTELCLNQPLIPIILPTDSVLPSIFNHLVFVKALFFL